MRMQLMLNPVQDINLKKFNFACKICGVDLTPGKIICYGTLCTQCWDKTKPDMK